MEPRIKSNLTNQKKKRCAEREEQPTDSYCFEKILLRDVEF